MKNPIKKIALLLAVLTCSSSFAATVSAKNIFVSSPHENDADADDEIIWTEPVEDDDEDESSDKLVGYNGGTFVLYDESKPVFTTSQKPFLTFKPEKTPYCDVISGGRYYSVADAKAELERYFNINSSDFYMVKGESRFFCDGAYFYSDDTDVVEYNKKTGELEAKGRGFASVYVYTNGGVPFYRLDITVGKNTSDKLPETLKIVPADQSLKIGDVTGFTITASDGKTCTDAVLSIKSGASRAYLNSKGKLVAEKNGAVVVHAESKSDPSVYGDCIIYIGSYKNAISYGCWTNCDGGIRVDKWCTSFYGNWFWRPCGWIKCADGILIPVLKLEEADIVKPDGSVVEGTVLTTGGISLLDIILGMFGGNDIITVINQYHLYNNGIFGSHNVLNWETLNFENLTFGAMLKDVIK